MRRMLILGLALSYAGGSTAFGDPYWIAYEGDDFPENVGWDRHWGVHAPPGDPNSTPDRSIEDGVFVLDTTSDIWLNDYYQIHRSIDPEPGELFVAEWQVAVDDQLVYWDAGLVIARDDPPGHVSFKFGVDSLLISTEDLEIELGADFHSFVFMSADMEEFDLFVDGVLLHQGVFESESLLQSYVGFGNPTHGASSLTRWDYLRFGAIPEPHSFLLAIIGLPILRPLCRSRHQWSSN